MHEAQNSQLLLKTLEITIYFPRRIYKYDPSGFWVGGTGKFSSGAGQITLRRPARFFLYLNHRRTNYVTSGQKAAQNVGPKMFGVHPRGSRRSFITKPLSATTLSPLSNSERIPDCFVLFLSDMPPVYNLETKVTLPEGAIPNSALAVVVLVYCEKT